jgi:outer membrane protein
MKNSNSIIKGILAVVVIVLFAQCNGKGADSKNQGNAGAGTDSAGFRLPIAYIRTDSLITNYKFFKDLNDAYMKKMEDKRLDISRRNDKFQKEVVDFQQKVKNNVFISQERAEQEQSRLQGLQQELQNYAAQVDKEMGQEQGKMLQQMQDTIISALKLYNTPKKYEMIFSNAGTDNILYADESYDITTAFIEYLNARYVPSK